MIDNVNDDTKDLEISEADREAAMKAEFGEASEAPPQDLVAETALEAVDENDYLPSELEDTQALSIIESLLFAAAKPMTVAALRGVFHGTNIDSDKLRDLISTLQTQYAGGERGIELHEVAGGYQLRTKLDNSRW